MSSSTTLDKSNICIATLQHAIKSGNIDIHSSSVLQDMAAALEAGEELKAKTLSGGIVNHSYKIFIKDQPEIAVFGKLAFPYHVAYPQLGHFDLERTNCEFEMQKLFAVINPDCTAAPLLCLDVVSDNQEEIMKLLVTEWSTANSQLANQFVSGEIDSSIAPKLGAAVARLHSYRPFDKDFNTKAARSEAYRNGYKSMEAAFFDKVTNYEAHFHPRVQAVMKKLGRDRYIELAQNATNAAMNRRDCYIHGDHHSFNILVDDEVSDKCAVVDMEASCAGPIGKDLGALFCFPIMCATAHGLNDKYDTPQNILDFIDSTWDSYIETLRDAIMCDEDYTRFVCKDIIAWTGMLGLCWHYDYQLHNGYIPIEDKDKMAEFVEAAGVISLALLQMGNDDNTADVSVEDIRSQFRAVVLNEIAFLELSKNDSNE